jgi:hypothetical protein
MRARRALVTGPMADAPTFPPKAHVLPESKRLFNEELPKWPVLIELWRISAAQPPV